MGKTLLFLLLFTRPDYSLAKDYLVRILQVSKSGKTLSVDQGNIDDINFDDYGILLAKVKVDKKTKNKLVKDVYGQGRDIYKAVAKLKAVKVFNHKSVWIAYKTFLPQKIYRGASLLLFSESALLKGRRALITKKQKILSPKNKVASGVVGSLKGSGQLLSKKRANYYEESTLHGQAQHFDEDFKLLELGIWKDKLTGKELSYEGIYKGPYAESFSERKRVHQFEKMVVGFLNKFNDPNFSIEKLYSEQKTLQKSDDSFQQKGIKEHYYDEYQKDLSEKRKRDDKFYSDLLKKGDSWSDDYSDEELSELMNSIGSIREIERRNLVTAQKYNYQIFSSFGLNLINNENLKDRENTEQSKYDLELSLEAFFLKKLAKFRQFTLEAALRNARDSFTTGTFNIVSTEYSSSFHLNWYPFLPPTSIERNIIYFGIHTRVGFMDARIPSLDESGDYLVFSFPALKAGIKYSFFNGYGARLAFSLENINIERIRRNLDAGFLPDRERFTEGKLSFALSRFF